MADNRTLAAPDVTPETQRFWDAAGAGKLLIKRCGACGEPHYYPRAHCPFCLSSDTHWEESSGMGTLYSHSTMRRGPAIYTLAYVTLDEGPAVLTNIATDDPDALAIGQRMRVTFAATGEGASPVPMFAPE